jgi:hypothetical protein
MMMPGGLPLAHLLVGGPGPTAWDRGMRTRVLLVAVLVAAVSLLGAGRAYSAAL